jgi:hypothetical protein
MTSHPITAPPELMPGRRPRRTYVLGALSVAPLALGALLVVDWIFLAVGIFTAAPEDIDPAGAGVGFAAFGLIAILIMVSAVVAFVALLIDACTNRCVPPDRQPLWILVLILGNVVAFPAYWYLVWWRTPCGVSREPGAVPVSAAR